MRQLHSLQDIKKYDFTQTYKLQRSHDMFESCVANVLIDRRTKDDQHGEPSFIVKSISRQKGKRSEEAVCTLKSHF